MAKFTGIRIHLGAAHDDVAVMQDGVETLSFDRSALRKEGRHKEQGQLRRAVVGAWEASSGRDRKRGPDAKATTKARRAARNGKRWTPADTE